MQLSAAEHRANCPVSKGAARGSKGRGQNDADCTHPIYSNRAELSCILPIVCSRLTLHCMSALYCFQGLYMYRGQTVMG